MNEIRCPNCGKTFYIDEAGYAEILNQVRNDAFEKELHERFLLIEKDKKSEIELVQAKLANEMEKKIAEKNAEVERLKTELKSNTELIQAQAREMLKEEVSKKEAEIERLKAELKANTELVQAKATETLKDEVAKREAEIAKLKEELKSAELAKQLALKESISDLEKERDDLRRSLELKEAELKLREATLKEKYETQIRDREETIERLKDLKAKLSTKMVGETLEQHCEIEFNKIRATAFPKAYFEKDNDARTGSKGDYIFREYDDNGTELISIMFEMKNENDTTATKKKNEDFFKELDKDRTEKGCEYAVLVSMLEPNSELYNTGIVDVSYRYPKCMSSVRNFHPDDYFASECGFEYSEIQK